MFRSDSRSARLRIGPLFARNCRALPDGTEVATFHVCGLASAKVLRQLLPLNLTSRTEPMDSQTYDVVVIGTGPGGEGAAMQATKLGKSVAVVERFRRIGGNCTHRGTIPSKALRFAVYQVTSVLGNKLFRDVGLCRTPTFPELRRTAASVIEKQVDMRLSFYERNGVPVSIGHGQFKDANTLEVLDEYGGN